jgi:ATP-binding cassette subfamily B protein
VRNLVKTNNSRLRDLRRGLDYLKAHRAVIPFVVLLALGASALTAIEPLVHGSIFHRLADLGRREANLRALLPPVLFLAGIVVVRQILEAAAALVSSRVRLSVHRALLSDATKKLHTLPLAYHHEHGVGEIVTRVDRGAATLVEGLSAVAFQMVPTAAYLLMSTVIMVHLHAWLAGIAILFVLPPVLLGRRAAARLLDHEGELMDRWCRIYNRFHQVLAGIKTVKAFAREADEQGHFIESVGDAQGRLHSAVRTQTRATAAQAIWVNLGRVVVLGVGSLLVARGELALGSLVAFVGYVGGLYGPAQTLVGLYVTARRAELGLSTFFKVVDAEDSVPDSPLTIPPGQLRGAIELERVSFKYGAAEANAPPTLDDVSLAINQGEFLALVGHSGSGKTTLVDLILRLHDPTSGVLRVDGHDLRHVSQAHFRRQLGIVTQEPFFFDDTVAANIRYGRPDASLAAVERAARAALAHDFVSRLPDGYQTRIGRGGAQLSRGELQQIAIARTFLKDPAVVLLDEPTSSLDVESELAVQRAVGRLSLGRTTIVVSHRPSLVARANRIVVLSGGKVVEDGPPHRLLASNGHYRRMMKLWNTNHPQITA